MKNEYEFIAQWFLGPDYENDDYFEHLIMGLLRDHMSWRHGSDDQTALPIKKSDRSSADYTKAKSRIKKQLQKLLELSTRTSSPQYQGKRVSSILLPDLIAKLAATIFNPVNNPEDEIAHTTAIEFEAGQQIAKMLGFNTDPEDGSCALGHMTSSCTTANYESLRNARSVSFYPLAMKAAARKLHLDIKINSSSNQSLAECSSWECQNFSVDDVLELQEYCYQQLLEKEGHQSARNFFKQVNLHTVEHIGMAAFFADHWDAKQPLVLIPSTADDDWDRAMSLLGFGSGQLIKLNINNRMRVDCSSLERILTNAEQKKIPILAVIGILGTHEYGSVDPLAEMVQLRNYFSNKGLNFYFHVDASCGGYLSSLFRHKDDSMMGYNEIKSQFKYFPNENVYNAFSVIREADSVTLDPKKSGHLPFTFGVFIRKDGDTANLLFRKTNIINGKDKPLLAKDDYISEKSPSTIDTTAYYFTQKVLPLNNKNYGRILSSSIRGCEYLRERIEQAITNLKDSVNIVIPMQPDTNVLCLAINPINNDCLTRMNRFSDRVFKYLTLNQPHSVQSNPISYSSGSLLHSHIGREDVQHILKKLGIKKSSFVVNIEDPSVQTNSIHILKHNLLNPWLLKDVAGKNAIDSYCAYLEQVIIEVVSKESSHSLVIVSAR